MRQLLETLLEEFEDTQKGFSEIVHRDLEFPKAPNLIQVAFDISDPAILAREEWALKEAEKELAIPNRIIDFNTYIKTGLYD